MFVEWLRRKSILSYQKNVLHYGATSPSQMIIVFHKVLQQTSSPEIQSIVIIEGKTYQSVSFYKDQMFEEKILDFILVILLFESVKSALMYKQLRLILPVSPSISGGTRLSSATSAIWRQKTKFGWGTVMNVVALHRSRIYILTSSSGWDKVMCLMFRFCLHSELQN